jgi:hypothetical protein
MNRLKTQWAQAVAVAVAATLVTAACGGSEPTAPPPPPLPTTGTFAFRLDAQTCAGYTTRIEFFINGQSKGAFTMIAGGDKDIEVAPGAHLAAAQQLDDFRISWSWPTVSVAAGAKQILLMKC